MDLPSPEELHALVYGDEGESGGVKPPDSLPPWARTHHDLLMERVERFNRRFISRYESEEATPEALDRHVFAVTVLAINRLIENGVLRVCD